MKGRVTTLDLDDNNRVSVNGNYSASIQSNQITVGEAWYFPPRHPPPPINNQQQKSIRLILVTKSIFNDQSDWSVLRNEFLMR